jgi:inosine-uridine nucleoside N-ribohydrolase
MKIIIDTDPGVDDAMAIFYAHSAPDIELLGLTTVFGNVWVDQATRNAGCLLDVLGANYPIAEGAQSPLEIAQFKPSAHVHGSEGFGDYVNIATSRQPVQESASEFLVRSAREHPGELVVCAVSPLTNIADAIRLDSEFVNRVKKIVIMGGAMDVRGNITPYAEANIYHDPHAAAEVFASGADITLVGLDVTLQTLCTLSDFQELADSAPVSSAFLLKISEFYMRFYEEVAKKNGCAMHDVTAVIAATHEHLFDSERVGVGVNLSGPEIGKIIREDTNPAIEVCLGIDAKAVKSLFQKNLSRLG